MTVIPINITQEDRILIIAPHPDDECIGAGGLLSLYPELCDVIVLTDGRQGQKDVVPEKVKEKRRQEFEQEMKYIRVHSYKMLGYEDGALFQQMDCLCDIDFSVYTKIFIPWGDDNHPDHTAGYLFSMERIRQQHITEAEIYQYEVHVPFHDTSHMLDITSVIEKKIKLIRFHRTQLSALAYDSIAKALGKYRACQCNLPEKYLETYLKADAIHNSMGEEVVAREMTLQKYMQFYRVLIRWLSAKQEGNEIVSYLKSRGLINVAIYGYSDMGKLLYNELLQSSIAVTSILDKRDIQCSTPNLKIQLPSDGNMKVDAVLVTAVYYYDEIKLELMKMGYKNILSLQKIVEELNN
ncbi:PIG-L deacetylase family protein [Lacrimispora sp.]|uniref:PIG-L deacetylase family protein n=1 Tax=Lacrimispora sp. TaxID=2719234 RepID=UPI00285F8A87|nr:PIG-L deacetylase family protein [Lacrimispora sp.]MDR7813500.1 PIG-L deacetylase family protein [Lacrimispora sp.]